MSIQRLSLIILPTAGYAALSIFAGGGISSFFSESARGALIVVLFALSFAAFFTDAGMRTGVREDRSNRWVIAVFAVLGLLAAYLPAYTDRIGFWTIDGATWRWFGVLLFAIGGVVRLWPVFVLGRRFSGLVAIQPGHTLVTTGIYSLIRHPSYLGLLVSTLGWGLGFNSGVGVLLAVLMIGPVIGRIHAEERFLRSEFGDQYIAYCARTSRLIPGIY